MKPPTIRFGEYRIRYRQVPYVERFFFVDILDRFGKWVEFSRIISFQGKHDVPLWHPFGFLQSAFMCNNNFTPRTYKRLVAFMNKVKQYDDYLDEQ